MNEANEKGAALERATRAIEEMVIRSQPGLAQAQFSIRPNAIIICNGVRHEIDLLVKINEGSPYETLHIFECKNWQEPVDKNVVTVFADKVEALNAARGTLIGRSFTRDAKAQAKNKGKLELAIFDENIWLPLTNMRLQGTGHHLTRFKAHVGRSSGTPDLPEPEWATALCRHDGRELPFTQFSYELVAHWLEVNGIFKKEAGNHNGSDSATWLFEPGELTIGTWPVERLGLEFDYEVSIRPGRLVSTFSIEKRGRFARFECDPDPVDGTIIAVDVVGKAG